MWLRTLLNFRCKKAVRIKWWPYLKRLFVPCSSSLSLPWTRCGTFFLVEHDLWKLYRGWSVSPSNDALLHGVLAIITDLLTSPLSLTPQTLNSSLGGFTVTTGTVFLESVTGGGLVSRYGGCRDPLTQTGAWQPRQWETEIEEDLDRRRSAQETTANTQQRTTITIRPRVPALRTMLMMMLNVLHRQTTLHDLKKCFKYSCLNFLSPRCDAGSNGRHCIIKIYNK